jgi:hypothetical protein
VVSGFETPPEERAGAEYSALYAFDLSNPDSPGKAGEIPITARDVFQPMVSGTLLYFSHAEKLSATGGVTQLSYYLDMVDIRDISSLGSPRKINVPGRVIGMDDAGEMLYTLDYREEGISNLYLLPNALSVLRFHDGKAYPQQTLFFDMMITAYRVENHQLYMTFSPYWSEDPSDIIGCASNGLFKVFHIAKPPENAGTWINPLVEVILDGYSRNLQKAGDLIFIQTGNRGGFQIFKDGGMYDQTKPWALTSVGYMPTLSPDAFPVIIKESTVYIPSGLYGVERMAIE